MTLEEKVQKLLGWAHDGMRGGFELPPYALGYAARENGMSCEDVQEACRVNRELGRYIAEGR